MGLPRDRLVIGAICAFVMLTLLGMHQVAHPFLSFLKKTRVLRFVLHFGCG
jgi:hypothetical protein